MNSILKEPTDPLTKAILLSGSRTFRITSKKSLSQELRNIGHFLISVQGGLAIPSLTTRD